MPTCLRVHIYQLFRWLKALLERLLVYNLQAKDLIRCRCAEDFFFWYEFFVCQKTIKASEKHQYSLLEPYQINYIRQLIRSINSGEDLLVEKSIKMGATTMTSLVFLWYWLYKDNSNLMILTRTKKSQKEILLKCLHLLCQLPADILPDGLADLATEAQKEFSKNRGVKGLCLLREPRATGILKNPENGNILYLFSSYYRVYPVRSRPFRAVFFDDLAFQRNQQQHWESFGRAGCIRIGASCPNGMANFFYTLVHSGVELFKLHWVLKNKASEEWYRAQTEGCEAVFVEQYFNINYSVRQVKKRATKAVCQVEAQVEATITSEEAGAELQSKVLSKVKPRPKRLSFAQWDKKFTTAMADKPKSRRHANPVEEVDTPQSYFAIQDSLTESLFSLKNTPEQVTNYRSQCLCSLMTALVLVKKITGMAIELSAYQPKKEAFYVRLDEAARQELQIPYDAQVAEARWHKLNQQGDTA